MGSKWDVVQALILDKIEETIKRNSLGEAREWANILSAVAHAEKVKSEV